MFNKPSEKSLNRSFFSGITFFCFLALFTRQVQAQCTPTSATLCASGDDYMDVYVDGNGPLSFGYVGAFGTNDAGNPTCVTIPTSELTGTCVSLDVEAQNTAPENNYASWDLDITCSGGDRSEITSASGGISVYYTSSGDPSTAPGNDSGGNPWYSPSYNNSPGDFTTSYCSSGVTASTWADQIYNPVTGQLIPFIANNCSGDYSTSNSAGAIFFRQCVPIPPPATLIGPPNFTVTKSQGTTTASGGDLFLTYTITVCNTGGPVTTGPVTITDNLTTVGTGNGANSLQFVAWGYGDSQCAFSIPYYSSPCDDANEPTATSDQLIFPNFGNGCVTAEVAVESYYWPASSCITATNNAIESYSGGSVTSNSVTLMITCVSTSPTITSTPTNTVVGTTPTLSLTATFTPSPTPTTIYTPTVTPTVTNTLTNTAINSPTVTNTPSNSPTSSLTPTATSTNSVPITFTATLTPSATPILVNTDTPTPTSTPTIPSTFTPLPTQTASKTSTPSAKPTVIIFPNPSKGGAIELNPNLTSPSNVTVEIFSVSFKKLLDLNFKIVPPGEDLPIPLVDNSGTPLANGLYYLVIQTKQGRSIVKLVILR